MLEAFFGNRILTAPLVAWLIAQLIKTLTILIRDRRLDLRKFVSAGGMPSAHSAVVMALVTAIGRGHGLDTPLFALAVWFAAIVMYDAAGVRRAVGAQAGILNRMLDDVFVSHNFNEKRLVELIGHTPVQVIAGAILGIVCGLVWV